MIDPQVEPELDKISNIHLDEIFNDVEKSKKSREGALDRIKKKYGELKYGFDNSELKDIVTVGLTRFNEGARSFTKFSEKLLDDLGDKVKPYLESIYDGIIKRTEIIDAPIKDWIIENKWQLNLEYNENNLGTDWYHAIAYAVYKKIDPRRIKIHKEDIEKIIGKSDKPLNEQFADAFVEMFTNPDVPKTRLQDIIKKELNVPESYKLKRRIVTELRTTEPKKSEQKVNNFNYKNKKKFYMKNIFEKILSIDLFKILLIVLFRFFFIYIIKIQVLEDFKCLMIKKYWIQRLD